MLIKLNTTFAGLNETPHFLFTSPPFCLNTLLFSPAATVVNMWLTKLRKKILQSLFNQSKPLRDKNSKKHSERFWRTSFLLFHAAAASTAANAYYTLCMSYFGLYEMKKSPCICQSHTLCEMYLATQKE